MSPKPPATPSPESTMLFPYGTDAPLYYRPIATTTIIATNVAMFLSTGMGDFEPYRWLILEFDRINPLQWITAAFMHASWMHLIGNMIFLWSFGILVEGKLGWRHFSLLYLVLCLADGAIGQIPMFLLYGYSGALGASGVIFALIAIAMVWAPQNEMDCLFAPYLFYIRSIEVPVLALGGFYLILQLIPLALWGFQPSSALFHLMGMAVGFPIAIWMLQRGWVDCEGWDLLSNFGESTSKATSFSFNPLFLVGSLFRDTPRRKEAFLHATRRNNSSGHDALRQIMENPDEYNPRSGQRTSATSTRSPKNNMTTPFDTSNLLPDKRPAAAGVVRPLPVNEQAPRVGNTDLTLEFANRCIQLGHGNRIPCRKMLRLIKQLTAQQRYLESLPLLRTLASRGDEVGNHAKLRIAEIEFRFNNQPKVAISTLRSMARPWDPGCEKRRLKLMAAAMGRIGETVNGNEVT
ncbi:rhomboid family intramembrane serine protease [Novipirellula artificiosorum]|uniref:Intramembrane serine protease GlpG n=1 Tax=Novipirellula artificiosorum TaxID=2528016 RepID=A0A5C6DEA8_9BACT|nr:rhomboid family intramembrane serine protease [Novipirellula artificiosorum]TWU35052.1 intramembrane serine protease GlpG [Novipirellula artificiosorum]